MIDPIWLKIHNLFQKDPEIRTKEQIMKELGIENNRKNDKIISYHLRKLEDQKVIKTVDKNRLKKRYAPFNYENIDGKIISLVKQLNIKVLNEENFSCSSKELWDNLKCLLPALEVHKNENKLYEKFVEFTLNRIKKETVL